MTSPKKPRKLKSGNSSADGKKRRGFASMDPARVREIASMGGSAVPSDKRAFSDPEVARRAGKIGGARPKPWLRKKFLDAK